MASSSLSADQMADQFVNYLFNQKDVDRHVRRVASWIGLIMLGIEKVKDSWKRPTSRQLKFEIGDKRYKAKYDHKLGRGGIEILEIAKTRGEEEGRTVTEIASLDDARTFFQNADRLDW